MSLVTKKAIREALEAARARNFELSEPELLEHVARALCIPAEAVREVAEEGVEA